MTEQVRDMTSLVVLNRDERPTNDCLTDAANVTDTSNSSFQFIVHHSCRNLPSPALWLAKRRKFVNPTDTVRCRMAIHAARARDCRTERHQPLHQRRTQKLREGTLLYGDFALHFNNNTARTRRWQQWRQLVASYCGRCGIVMRHQQR